MPSREAIVLLGRPAASSFDHLDFSRVKRFLNRFVLIVAIATDVTFPRDDNPVDVNLRRVGCRDR